MITAAVSTTRNEEDVVEASIRHLLAEGVGLVLVADASTDGTRKVLRRLERDTGCVRWFADEEPHHLQPQWIDRLAGDAHAAGADWIVPFDADEWWLGLGCLPGLDANVAVATLWHHVDWDRKVVPAERLPKVAYRWRSDARVANGNHDINIPGARANVLEVRHYQYRGFDHFARKVRERNLTLDPAARERGDGGHHTHLEGATDEELHAAWGALMARETVYDPIPSVHGRYGLNS